MREMKSSSSQKEGMIQQQPSGNDGGTALDFGERTPTLNNISIRNHSFDLALRDAVSSVLTLVSAESL